MFKHNGLIFACTYVFLMHSQVFAASLDPTRPLGYGAGAVSTTGSVEEPIVLNSILISNDRRVAIINGQQLRESQMIKGRGVLLKRIDADAVTLQQGDKVWRLPLNTTIIRK